MLVSTVPVGDEGEFDVCCVSPDPESSVAEERVIWLAADSEHDVELLRLLSQVEGWMGAILQYSADHAATMKRFWTTDGVFRRAARGKQIRHQQVLLELQQVVEIVQRDLARCRADQVSSAASQAFETDEISDQRRADTAFEGCGDKAALIERIKTELYPRLSAVIRLMHEAVAGFDIERYREVYRDHAETSTGWIATLSSGLRALGAGVAERLHGFLVFVRTNKQQLAVQVVGFGVAWALPSALLLLNNFALVQQAGQLSTAITAAAPVLFRTGQVAMASYYAYRRFNSVVQQSRLLYHLLFTATTIYASDNRAAGLAKLPSAEVQQRMKALFATVDATPGMAAVFQPELVSRLDDAAGLMQEPSPQAASAVLRSVPGQAVTAAGAAGLHDLTQAIGLPPADVSLARTLETPIPTWLRDPTVPDRSPAIRAQLKLKGVLDTLTRAREHLELPAMLKLIEMTSKRLKTTGLADDLANSSKRDLLKQLPMLMLHHTVMEDKDWRTNREAIEDFVAALPGRAWSKIGTIQSQASDAYTNLKASADDKIDLIRSQASEAYTSFKTSAVEPTVATLTTAYSDGVEIMKYLLKRSRLLMNKSYAWLSGPSTELAVYKQPKSSAPPSIYDTYDGGSFSLKEALKNSPIILTEEGQYAKKMADSFKTLKSDSAIPGTIKARNPGVPPFQADVGETPAPDGFSFAPGAETVKTHKQSYFTAPDGVTPAPGYGFGERYMTAPDGVTPAPGYEMGKARYGTKPNLKSASTPDPTGQPATSAGTSLTELADTAQPWIDMTLKALDMLPYLLALAMAQPEKAMVMDLGEIPRQYRQMPATVTPFNELTPAELRQLARLNKVPTHDIYGDAVPPETVYAHIVDALTSDALRRDRITLLPDANALYKRCRLVHKRYESECQRYALEHAEVAPEPSTPAAPGPRRRSTTNRRARNTANF